LVDHSEAMGVRIEAERRHLTMVFCDLVGSTELSTKVDAEEFSDIVQEYQDRAVTVARQLGGDVEGYSGDGILFRFGWPEAHDDDVERALRAALEIVDAVGRCGQVTARVGVHSGVVVVGEMGAPGRRATMALGETINLTARLQAVADPGTVVASAATVALAKGTFVVQALGGQRLKGIDRSVKAFIVQEPYRGRRRVDAGGRLTPFLGRQAELTALQESWRSAATGKGSSVLVMGEPGVGKSRLLYEMGAVLLDLPHRWLDCSCSSYTQMSALWPVVQLIERSLQLHADEDPRAPLDRLRQGLDAAGIDDPEAPGLMAALLGLPGVELPPMSPERRRERTIAVLTTWLVELTRSEPLVLVVEDLQWCDPTSLDLIGRLQDHVGNLKLLVLMTARPEFTPRWKAEQVMKIIQLDPLEDDDVQRLVGAVGGQRALPPHIVDRIVEAAAGIPLFAEEVSRSVLESGVLIADDRQWRLAAPGVSLQIPDTLQSSLLARLDRLGPAKAVAQVAAAIGRTFSFDLLLDVSGMDAELLAEQLCRLVDSDLVLVEGAPPVANYVFKHALVQDVAYDSLLRRTRRVVHDRIARALVEGASGGAHVAPEVIARHFEAAGAARQALEHYLSAARQAAEHSAYREAMGFLRHGLGLLEGQPAQQWRSEMEIELRLALCSSIIATRSYSDAQIETEYDRVRDLCETLGNDRSVGLALAGLSIFHTNRGRTALGAELAERVLDIAQAHGDDMLELLACVQLALPRTYQGRSSEALAHALRAVTIYDPERHRDIAQRFGTDHGVAAHVCAGWAYLIHGYLDHGMAQLEAAERLAVDLGHPFHLVYALAFKATGHWERGESAQTLDAAQRARVIAEEQGFAFWAGVSGVWEVAEHVISGGDRSAAAKVVEAGFVAGESGNRGGSTAVMARVAEAVRASGDLDTASGIVDMALAVSQETQQLWWDGALHRMLAEMLLEAADNGVSSLGRHSASLGAAEQEWLVAMALAEARTYPVHGLRAAVGYARLLERQHRIDKAWRVIDTWYRRCPEGWATQVLRAADARRRDLQAERSSTGR
jgi:class 3 adenylate cyclase